MEKELESYMESCREADEENVFGSEEENEEFDNGDEENVEEEELEEEIVRDVKGVSDWLREADGDEEKEMQGRANLEESRVYTEFPINAMEKMSVSFESAQVIVVEAEEDFEQELESPNNKSYKAFRDPASAASLPVRQPCIKETSVSSEEIRRKVASSFKKRAPASNKAKNRSKTAEGRNIRETVKGADMW